MCNSRALGQEKVIKICFGVRIFLFFKLVKYMKRILSSEQYGS